MRLISKTNVIDGTTAGQLSRIDPYFKTINHWTLKTSKLDDKDAVKNRKFLDDWQVKELNRRGGIKFTGQLMGRPTSLKLDQKIQYIKRYSIIYADTEPWKHQYSATQGF